MAHSFCFFAAGIKTVIMKGYIELYYDLPHLEAFMEAGGAQYNLQALKNEIDDFLREAVLHHIEEKKFVIMGTLTEYLENKELFEGSRDLFRRMPTISSDIFFDTDASDLLECSDYLAEKEQPALLNWKRTGKHGEQKLFRTTADVLFAKEKESENQTDNDKLLDTDLSELDEITADMFCSSRGNEIKAYFEETGMDMNAQRYVIMDDLKDVLPEQEDHFIRIDSFVGITEEDAERAIEII